MKLVVVRSAGSPGIFIGEASATDIQDARPNRFLKLQNAWALMLQYIPTPDGSIGMNCSVMPIDLNEGAIKEFPVMPHSIYAPDAASTKELTNTLKKTRFAASGLHTADEMDSPLDPRGGLKQ